MSENHMASSNTEGGKSPVGDMVPFELWLDKKLKTAYGSVLEEQIPQDLIDLLRKKLDGG